jgi:hypothetical protein
MKKTDAPKLDPINNNNNIVHHSINYALWNYQ